MRITFALPFLNRTGGVRAVLDLSNALHDRGHTVHVVAPAWPYRFHHRWIEAVKDQYRRWQARQWPWRDMRCSVRRVPWLHEAFLPPADLVVGTSWPVLEDLARVGSSRGRTVHLVFHHETDTGDGQRVVDTYRLPGARIAVSLAVRDELRARFGCAVDAVAALGIDRTVFFPEGQRDRHTVLMLYHDAPRKGASDGLRALSDLKATMPDLRVHVCGTMPLAATPAGAVFTLEPDDRTLRSLYSTAAVVLYPSRYEGFGLPPLEAMACGTPVVTTAVGAVPEYAVSGENAIVVAPGDVAGMVRGLRAVLADPVVAARLAANGLVTAGAYDWTHRVEAFERALEGAVGRHPGL